MTPEPRPTRTMQAAQATQQYRRKRYANDADYAAAVRQYARDYYHNRGGKEKAAERYRRRKVA